VVLNHHHHYYLIIVAMTSLSREYATSVELLLHNDFNSFVGDGKSSEGADATVDVVCFSALCT